ITACLKAVLETKDTIGTGGAVTAVYFAGAADFFGAKLFLGEDGKPSSTAGTTYHQPIGILLSRNRILIDLVPRASGHILVGEGATLALATNEGIKVDFTFSLATTGGLNGIESNMDYEPAGDSGYATPVGIVGRATLKAGMTFTGGQAGMEGVRGHLAFEDGAILNQASSIFTGLRGVITKSGTPVFTAFDTIACLYCDNLCATNMAGIASTYGSALISLQNHGGTLDAGIIIRGGNKLSAIFKFVTCGGVINSGVKSSGAKNIKVNIDGTVYYWNLYNA
ncbi:hypothetical protein LCGC14_3105700, partial [marine sediment metagenome]